MDQREITNTTGGSTSHELQDKHLLVCVGNANCLHSFAYVGDSFLQTLVWISGEYMRLQHYILERSYIGHQASGLLKSVHAEFAERSAENGCYKKSGTHCNFLSQS